MEQQELHAQAEWRLDRIKIPEWIDIDQISMEDRGRTTYGRIEELAQSISDNGLIQPIVLVPLVYDTGDGEASIGYGLDAGGRRLVALKHLDVKKLWHATTCDPDRPGFVLKGEDQATPLRRLYTEIAENLDRENLDWRDEMKLLNKAWTLSRAEADSKGEKLLMRDFGAMIGVGYANLQAATAIYSDVVAHPDRYKECYGIRAAYSVLLKVQADELHKIQTSKSIVASPLMQPTEVTLEPKVLAQPEPEPGAINIPITNAFFNLNGIDWLKSFGYNSVDHIITDPDYGVSLERLEASVSGAAQGVHHETIEHSLSDLYLIIKEAWRVIKPQGFLVFWYDLDHHEKLQHMATDLGFMVQRWPLIWVKTDYRSNSAPAYNFTKNIEYAMICRKPNAVLARAQTSSVYSCAAGPVVKELGHPFAKPYELWQWIYSAVTIKGQTVADPCAGRGSSSIAALRWGLRPLGSEIDVDHYHGLLVNLQNAYRKELGNRVTFS